MDNVFDLQDKAYDSAMSLSATLDNAIMDAYLLGKQDGAREALDTAQYIDPAAEAEGCGCDECREQQLLDALDAISDSEDAFCPCGCGLTIDETGEEEELFTWTPDVSVDEGPYVVFADGVEVPLATVIEMVVDDLTDLDARLVALEKRTA